MKDLIREHRFFGREYSPQNDTLILLYKLIHMSLTRKVAYNTVALVVGRGINTILALITTAALTRYLGVAGYGQYTTIFAFVSLFNTFADFGFMMILLKELGAGRYKPEVITRNILAIRTVFAIVVYTICFAVGWFLNYPPVVQWGIGIIAFAFLWSTIQGTVIAVLQANLRADKAVLGDAINRAIILILVLWFGSRNAGLATLLWAYPAGTFVGFIINWFYANKFIRLGFSCDFKLWKKLIIDVFPLGIAGIFSIIYFKVDSVMLSLMKTPEDIGIYGAPYKIFEVLLALSALFMGVAFPILTRYLHSKQIDKFNRALQKSVDFLLLLALPIVVFSIILAPAIIDVIAGNDFVVASTLSIFGRPATAVTTLQVLAITVLLSYMTNIFNNLVIAANKQNKLVLPNFILIIINIGLNLLLIPSYSYIGGGLATVITEIFALIFNFWIAKRHVEFTISAAIFAKGAIATVGMIIVTWILRDMFIAIPLIVGSLFYIIIVLLTKAIPKDMVREIIKG